MVLAIRCYAGPRLQVNGVRVLNSAFESNAGIAVLINGGYQVLVQGNTLESMGSAAIFARGVAALSVRSNYFEANNFAPLQVTICTR